jgi:tape measure domain-containing protein
MYTFKFGVVESITRTQQAITGGFERMRKAAGVFTGETRMMPKSIEGLRNEMNRLQQAQSRAMNVGDVRRYGLEIKRLDSELNRLQGTSTKVRSGLSSMLPAVGVGMITAVGNESMKAARDMDSMTRSISFASGGAKPGKEALGQIRTVVSELGMPLEASMKGFKTLAGSMMGSKLQGAAALDVFRGMGEASSALGIDAADVGGSFVALGQMVGKGKVSMEEMRQQIGERLPGAFNIGARAMGMTSAEFDKMISKGSLTADVFLPKFAKELHKTFGPEAQKAASSSTAEWNRYQNAILEAKVAFGEGVLPIFLKFTKEGLIPALTYVKDHKVEFAFWAKNVWELGTRVLALYVGFKLFSGIRSTWAAIPEILQIVSMRVGDVRSGFRNAWIWSRLAGSAALSWGRNVLLAAGTAVRSIIGVLFQMRTLVFWKNLMGRTTSWWRNAVLGFGNMMRAGMRFVLTLIPAMWTWISTLSFASIGQALLNTIMLANPVGLIIAGVLGLTAVFYGLFKLIDNLLPGFFDNMIATFKSVWDFIKKYFIDPLVKMFTWLLDMTGMSMSMPSIEDPKDPKLEADLASYDNMLNAPSGGGGTGSGKSGSNESAAVVGKAPKNVTVNIGKLVEKLEVHTTNLQGDASKVKDELIRLLLTAVNDAQLAN